MLGGMPNPAAEIWCAVARLDMNGAVATEEQERKMLLLPPTNKMAQRAGITLAQ